MYPSFVFVRHAESVHNEKTALLEKQFPNLMDIKKTPQYKQLKYSTQMLDGDISQRSKQLFEPIKKKINLKQIDIVVVSPLLRCLKTADLLFGAQEHIKFFVQPLMAEQMSSAVDIGSKLGQSRKTYGKKFDFSRIPEGMDDRWFLDFNLSEEPRQRILKIVEEDNISIPQATLKVISQGKLQDFNALHSRSEKLKQKLMEYKKMSKKKVALVGHSRMLQILSATGFHENGEMINAIFLKNLEVRSVQFVVEGYKLQGNDVMAFCKI